ncbi:MAG: MBL fold metallo-hydrolase [Desulfurococcaceae archaeon]
MPKRLLIKGVRVSRRGFAGLLLEYNSRSICIDPGSALEGCGVVLCTHSHARHCLPDVVGSLSELVSPFAGRLVKPGGSLEVSGVRVSAFDAYNRPELSGEPVPHPRGLGVGFLLAFPSGLRVCYTGDTDLVEEVVEACRGVDLLAVPVGGGCVMAPEEALELIRSVRPAITLPLHAEKPEQYFKLRDMAQPYTQVVILREA